MISKGEIGAAGENFGILSLKMCISKGKIGKIRPEIFTDFEKIFPNNLHKILFALAREVRQRKNHYYLQPYIICTFSSTAFLTICTPLLFALFGGKIPCYLQVHAI